MSRKRKYKKKRLKIFSWKELNKRFRIKKKLRLFGVALLVLVATFGTYVSIYIFQSIRNPFVRAEGGPEIPFSWQAKEPKSFAWLVAKDNEHKILEDAAIFHLDPHTNRLVVFDISERNLSLSHGVSSCLSSISREVSLPVTGYFLIEKSALERLKSENADSVAWKKWGLTTLFKLPVYIRNGKGHFWSNLSLPEFMRVSKFILGTREDQRIMLEQGSGEDPANIVSNFFTDQKLKSEGLRILVLNGTKVSGLAGGAELWLKNLGCFVLDVGNAPQQNHEESLILATDPRSYTVQRIASSLQIDVVKKLDSSLDWAKRADMVLILGIDKKDYF